MWAQLRRVQLCESRGGRPGLPVLMSLMPVFVDVMQQWTMLTHWSQFDPNMSTPRHPRTLSSTSSSWAQPFCRELSCAVRRISDAIVSSVRYIPARAETTQGIVSLERPRTDSDHAADTSVKLSTVETNEGHIFSFLLVVVQIAVKKEEEKKRGSVCSRINY